MGELVEKEAEVTGTGSVVEERPSNDFEGGRFKNPDPNGNFQEQQ